MPEPDLRRPEPLLLRLLSWGGEWTFVALVMAVGLLLRAAVVILAIHTRRYELAWDEVFVAQRMAAGLGFSFDYYSRLPWSPGPSVFFPPGYVYNVWWLLRAFHSVLAIAWENALLSAAVCVALYFMAKRLFDPLSARATLVLAAFYPPFLTRIPHSAVVFPKMLPMVLMMMALLRVWNRRGAAAAIAAGLAGGVLALMMPDVITLLAALALLLVLVPPRGWRSLRAALLVLGATALVIAPWTIRNWTCFHRVCLVSANGGFNFYMGNRPHTDNEVDVNVIAPLDSTLGGELARADEIGRERILYREGLRWMRDNPREAASAVLMRIGLHWSLRPANFRSMGLVKDTPAPGNWVSFSYAWSYAIAYGVVLLLAMPGLWLARRRWAEFVPILLVFLYSTAVAAFFVMQSKMRLMKVDPFLLVFAGAFLVAWLSGGRAGAGAAAGADARDAGREAKR